MSVHLTVVKPSAHLPSTNQHSSSVKPKKSAHALHRNISTHALEKAAAQEINAYRQSKGLKPLIFSHVLYTQASIHSKNMASGTVAFSHDGFKQRFKAVKSQEKVKSFAENVAFNQNAKSPSRTAVQGWIKSAGHHQNIVGDYNRTAIAVAAGPHGQYYFTQLFAKV
ncbi:CAP domain-containing protein [Estrella lausannensis]|uniref:Cysteine-rich secretory protein n=1 Tax=Estrella lausannensis TaxID=483423 RepID=A0A0H5DRD9_9BACT|nr:CAP domain-containing protein [Estrella lausannensis]CRX39147.1 Cysteine-rich secretory protein [Estrella lausannensis]